jgi:hypothetical protein
VPWWFFCWLLIILIDEVSVKLVHLVAFLLITNVFGQL